MFIPQTRLRQGEWAFFLSLLHVSGIVYLPRSAVFRTLNNSSSIWRCFCLNWHSQIVDILKTLTLCFYTPLQFVDCCCSGFPVSVSMSVYYYYYVYGPMEPFSSCNYGCRASDQIRDVSNKVDIARFPLRYARLRYNLSFDGYLHLSRLRNYGGRVHISLLLVRILSKKWQRRK